MTRTHEKVTDRPPGKRPDYTAELAARGIENVLQVIGGRWKLVILFQLFGGKTLRFSELERAIPGISQKMLIQQLRQLEKDEVVTRTVHPEVPPRVEYRLTDWGQSLCPALDSLLMWAEAASGEKREALLNLNGADSE
ncbi:winged helix-turn-helix transcriptional regulator [Tepidicaulis sp.]|uniref:winged helix-turn-helix transcriptional regulator n=1 Tax=Tepidicaulis sp. TaxID=1920809 RepID=UPI003B58D660